MVSRRTVLRRILPLAFLAGLVVLAGRTFHAEHASCELHFVAGQAAHAIDHLDVVLRRTGSEQVLGTFTADLGASRPPGGALGTWPLTADAGDYRLELTVSGPSGHAVIERAIEVTDGAVITVDLGDAVGRMQR